MIGTSDCIRLLDRSLSAVGTISKGAVVLGGLLMLASACLIAADVILRRIFGLSTWGADELSYYALAVSSSWAFAGTLLAKAHIRVDIVRELAPVPVRAILDVLALAGMAFFALFASAAIIDVFERSWRRGTSSITTLETPLWIPQGLWLCGFLLFSLVTGLLLLRVLGALLIERSYDNAARYGGVQTVEEETAAAASDIRAPSAGER
jgi:TRAP-type C4-dicarboxylate transport system permease small subunit